MKIYNIIKALHELHGYEYEEIMELQPVEIRELYEEEVNKLLNVKEVVVTRRGKIYEREANPIIKKAA